MKETFQIYLSSADAISGSNAPHRCEFDLSAIVPNVVTDRCRVRVSYFDVAVASSAWKTAGVSTIVIRTPNNMTGRSYETTPSSEQGVGKLFVRNSSIIGVCSTGNADTVTNMNVANSLFVPMGNIFSGVFTVELVDQDRGSLSSDLNSSSKSWSMVLDVEVEDTCGCHT